MRQLEYDFSRLNIKVRPKGFFKRLKQYSPVISHTFIVGIGLLLAGLFLGVGGYLRQYQGVFDFGKVVTDFYANASTELISIAITVLIIDALNSRRERDGLKRQLIREMGSTDNGIALRAVNELRAHDWLKDGSVNKSYLRGANLHRGHLGGAVLEGADLGGANLSEANLYGVNLNHADLAYANLQDSDLNFASLKGATLIKADLRRTNFNETDLSNACLAYVDLREARVTVQMLSQVNELVGATLPDGKRYSGFYNLDTDILSAKELGIDINDPVAMSDYYGVSIEEYQAGQEFARIKQLGIDIYDPVVMSDYYGVSIEDYQAGQGIVNEHSPYKDNVVENCSNAVDTSVYQLDDTNTIRVMRTAILILSGLLTIVLIDRLMRQNHIHNT